MLARRVERAIEEEGEIFDHKAQLFIFASWRGAREDLQGCREQPIIRTRMDRKARRKRVAEFGRHHREQCPLNMTVAVQKRTGLPEPAEAEVSPRSLP